MDSENERVLIDIQLPTRAMAAKPALQPIVAQAIDSLRAFGSDERGVTFGILILISALMDECRARQLLEPVEALEMRAGYVQVPKDLAKQAGRLERELRRARATIARAKRMERRRR